LAILAIRPPEAPWAILRRSGSEGEGWKGEVAYYGVGRSSTVLLFDDGKGWRLVTNGQPESTISRPSPTPEHFITARWLGMLPALLRPEARSMLMIGLGGGLSVEAAPSSIEKIHVIELEREVILAHQSLEGLRDYSPISDPRVQMVVNDARGALMLTDARFDTIVSQPSHPWTAGASHLYTREFFSLVSDHLEPDGVFVQWIGLAFIDEALLRSIVATLLDVFSEVAIYRPISGAILFAASNAEFDPLVTSEIALAATPSDYSRYGLQRVEDVLSGWSLDLEGARRFSAGADINTDDRNQLATRSAGLGNKALRTRQANKILAAFDPLPSKAAELKTTYLVRRLAFRSEIGRAVRLARSQRNAVQRMTDLGWAASSESASRAAAHFRAALERDPTSQSARFGLLAARRRAVEANDPEVRELAEPLEGAGAAVITGWRLAAAGEWPALGELEPELASAEWFDPAYQDAQRLRIRWRTASDDPALHAEAVEIARDCVRNNALPEDLVVAAKAFAVANRADGALQLLDALSNRRRKPWLARAGIDLIDSLPPEIDEARRAEVRDRLERGLRPAENSVDAG